MQPGARDGDGAAPDHPRLRLSAEGPRGPAPAFTGRAASESASAPVRPLSPSVLPPVPDPALGPVEARPARPVLRDLRESATRRAAPADDPDDELPARPGAFAPQPSKVPSTLHKQRVIAPHTASPDLEIDISRRSSVGVFGKVDRFDREDIRTNTVKEGRDLGAGVTFQYKFDSR